MLRWRGKSIGIDRLGRNGRNRRLSMESLEPRLALTWAGVPPVSIAPPTTAANVTLNASSDATGSATIASTEVDYFAFTATASGAFTIAATTPASSLGPVIGVFSSTGQRLAYNDDLSSTNTDSRLTVTLSAGTRYFLGVTNYSSTTRGAYTYTIDGPTPTIADDAYENNDSFDAAYNLGTLTANRTVSSLKLVDSEDWFRFTIGATGTTTNSVSISFANSQGNLQLALYNSSGTLLATSATTGNLESISLSGRLAGTYYLRVYGNAGVTNPSYTLSIAPPSVPTTPPPNTMGGFQITLSMSGLTASQQALFNQAADRWEQIIVGDLPNATYGGQTVDDLLINASAIYIDGVSGVLGQAGPDAYRAGTRLPYRGIMQFDSADLTNMERNGSLLGVVMHEMGHVLGIGTIWTSLGLLSGGSTSNPLFLGTQATAAYNQIFGTTTTGVPVENTGGSGTRNAHWRETILGSEIMTGWVNSSAMPISRITVASLADIGYTVNMAMADPFTPNSSAVSLAIQSSSGSSSARLYSLLSTEMVSGSNGSHLATPSHGDVPRAASPRSIFNETNTHHIRDAIDAVMDTNWGRSVRDDLRHFFFLGDAAEPAPSFAWSDTDAWSTWRSRV